MTSATGDGARPRSLVILRLSALGDVIHTIPAVVALREALPETRLSWAVEAPYAELVETVARVRPIPVRLKAWTRSPLAHRRDLREALRALHTADTSIDFQGLMKSAFLGFVSGAERRFGFEREAIREKPALLFLNRHVAVDTGKHVVEQNVDLARALAPLPPDAATAHGEWDALAADPDRELERYRGAVVLLAGAGKPEKLWPVDSFRALAAQIGSDAVVAWGPGERERAEAIGGTVAPPTNLRELAWLLRHARVVIGADTGPLHLAAALGTRVVGLYGPTDPRRNGPYGQLEHCVDRYRSTKLLESISVAEVMTMLARVAPA